MILLTSSKQANAAGDVTNPVDSVPNVPQCYQFSTQVSCKAATAEALFKETGEYWGKQFCSELGGIPITQ